MYTAWGTPSGHGFNQQALDVIVLHCLHAAGCLWASNYACIQLFAVPYAAYRLESCPRTHIYIYIVRLAPVIVWLLRGKRYLFFQSKKTGGGLCSINKPDQHLDPGDYGDHFE